MKYSMLLVLFFIYNIILYISDSTLLLFLYVLINFLTLIVNKIESKKYLKFLLKNILFVSFIFLCNIFICDLKTAVLMSIRLLLACSMAFLVSQILTPSKFSRGFYYLLYPLRIFKIDIKSLSLSISIALTFIPILGNEARNIRLALESKGFKFSIKNLIFRPQIFLINYIESIFDRIDEVEKSLSMKGYN